MTSETQSGGIPTVLMVGGVRLDPYAYGEEDWDGALHIRARVRVPPDRADRIHDLAGHEGYHPVVREGIDAAPREMRIVGPALWSRHGDAVKFRIDLVDRSFDEDPGRSQGLGRMIAEQGEPQVSGVRAMLAEYSEVVDELLAHLGTKGVLTAGEAAGIRQVASDRAARRRHDFALVDDIDTWAPIGWRARPAPDDPDGEP